MSARSSGVACVVPVQLDELAAFSSVRIYVPKDLRPPDARSLALKVHPFAPHLLTAMVPLAAVFSLRFASIFFLLFCVLPHESDRILAAWY